MKRLFFLSLLLLVFVRPTHAQDSDGGGTLLPGAKHEYRFDYKGDRTPIYIVVEAPEGIELHVFAPGQPEAVGAGSPKGGGLEWAGKFNAPGPYRATVENTSPGPLVYSIAFLGESVSGVSQIIPDTVPPSANISPQGGRLSLSVNLPGGERHFQSPVVPTDCTPPGTLPPVINSSLKLCSNEIYPPLRVVGNGIGLFGDDAHTAIINSAGRQFAVNLEGANNWVEGLVIQAAPDAADAGAFLCQYNDCVFPTQPDPTTINGSLVYGGGILVNGSNNMIHGVTVRAGTIGVATVNGSNNALVENDLSHLNGWGSYNLRSNNSLYVGNRFDYDDHGCTTPDGRKFESGCETAGWVCLQCTKNLIARNHCVASGNCYYMSGERALGSNNNQFVANYCAASPNNCFEVTFSKGNVFQDNIATADPQTGAICKYPFWIGGSTVYFGKNTWSCAISPDDSIAQAIASTTVPTQALTLGSANPPTAATTQPKAQATTIPPTERSQPPPPPPPRCDTAYRLPLLYRWDDLSSWLACLATPYGR